MGLEVVLFVISTTISIAQAVIAKKKAAAARDASLGQDVRVTNASEPLEIHYGKIATSGVRTVVATSSNFTDAEFTGTRIGPLLSGPEDKSGGKKNEFLATQVAIGIGEITSINACLTDDQKQGDKANYKWTMQKWNPGGTAGYSGGSFVSRLKPTNFFEGLTHATNVYKLNREEPQYSGVPYPLYFIKEGIKVKSITRSGTEGNYTYAITRNAENTADLLGYSNTVAYVLLDYITNPIYGVQWKLYTAEEKAADPTLVDDIDLESFYKAHQLCNTKMMGPDNVLDSIVTSDLDGSLPAETPLEVQVPAEFTITNENGETFIISFPKFEIDLGLLPGSPNYINTENTSSGITNSDSILRYEFNGSISTGANHRDNIATILSVIPGVEFFRSPTGQWKLVVPELFKPIEMPKEFIAGVYPRFSRIKHTIGAGEPSIFEVIVDTTSSDPSTTRSDWARISTVANYETQTIAVIDDSELVGEIEIAYPDSTNKYNQIDVRFPNVNKDYADDSIVFPPDGSAMLSYFLTQDNQKPLKDLYDMRGIVNTFHAKAWASNKVRQSRRETYSFQTRPSGFLYEPGDIVELVDPAAHFGNNRIFVKIQSTKVMSNLNVKFTAVRYFQSDYGWELTGLPIVENRLVISVSEAVTTISSAIADVEAREITLQITSNPDEDVAVSQYVIEHSASGSSNFSVLTTIPSSFTSYVHKVGDTAATHLYRMYAVTTDGRIIPDPNPVPPATPPVLAITSVSIGDRPAVITTTMTTTNGTVFKNNTGDTTLTMNVFLDGVLSTNHDDYTYSWQVLNASGEPKVIVVSDTVNAAGDSVLLNTITNTPMLTIGDPSTVAGRQSLQVPAGVDGVPADSLSTLTIANPAVLNSLRSIEIGEEDVTEFQQFTCIVGNLPN